MSFIMNFARNAKNTYVQFAVKRHIFIKCPHLVSFDSRSIVSVRYRAHTQESRVHRGIPGSLLNA
jgi:hypothetical protein